MFLGILTVLILLALGVLNAQTIVCEKQEKIKDCVSKLLPFEGYIGLAGIVFGLFGLLSLLGNITYIGNAFLYFLIGLVASLLALALGVLSSAALIKQQVANLAAPVDKIVAKLQPHQTNLGLAGIAVAVIDFFILITH